MSLTLNVNLTLFVIPCKKIWMIVDLKVLILGDVLVSGTPTLPDVATQLLESYTSLLDAIGR